MIGKVLIKVEGIRRINTLMKEYLKEVMILMKDMYHLKVKIIHYFLKIQIFVQHHQIIDKDYQQAMV